MNNELHGPHCFDIPTENLDAFNTKFNKLGKAAARCGMHAPGKLVVGNFERTIGSQEAGTLRRLTGQRIAVAADAARINGWMLVCKIDHLGAEGNIVSRLDGLDGDLGLNQAAANCEHCGTKQNRKVTYLLRDAAGTTKQVGTTCLVDFTGHPSAEAVASYAEFLDEVMSSGEGAEADLGPRGVQIYDVREVLARAAAVIQLSGYRSRSKCQPGEAPTADIVETSFSNSKMGEELRRDIETRSDAERAARSVAVAVAYLESLAGRPSLSDYESNLDVLFRRGAIEGRFFGYMVSALGAAEREAAQRRGTEFAPGHLGTVKQRMVVRLRLVGITEINNDFGVTVLHRFVDADGHQVIWMGSHHAYVMEKPRGEGQWASRRPIKVGALHWVCCTIKDHGQFRGVNQTKVNRLEVLSATYVKAEAAKAAKKAARAAKKAAKVDGTVQS